MSFNYRMGEINDRRTYVRNDRYSEYPHRHVRIYVYPIRMTRVMYTEQFIGGTKRCPFLNIYIHICMYIICNRYNVHNDIHIYTHTLSHTRTQTLSHAHCLKTNVTTFSHQRAISSSPVGTRVARGLYLSYFRAES